MHESVQPAELCADRARDRAEIFGGRRGEVEREDRRLRMSGRDDLVVNGLELAHHAPVQHHRGATGGAGEREGVRPSPPDAPVTMITRPAQINVDGVAGRGQGHGAARTIVSGMPSVTCAPMISDRGVRAPGSVRD